MGILDFDEERDDGADAEPVPTPIPPMPDGMTEIERNLFKDLRAAADIMADWRGVERKYLISDWVIFQIIATMPTSPDELNRFNDVRTADLSYDFGGLIKRAIVNREALAAAGRAAALEREARDAEMFRKARQSMHDQELDRWVASLTSTEHSQPTGRDD